MFKRFINIFLFVCLTLVTGVSGVKGTPLGSSRPEVQKNYQKLIATRTCPGCYLAGVVLIRAALRGVNLEGANLAGAQLNLADLANANLKNANLQGAALGGADLANADLSGANLTGAVLEGAFLETAIMDGKVVTRPQSTDEEELTRGEKVYVPNESSSKTVPYTQEAVVAKDQVSRKGDGADQTDEKKKSQPVKSASSKKIMPMADAVVPEEAVENVEKERDAGALKKLASSVDSKSELQPADVRKNEESSSGNEVNDQQKIIEVLLDTKRCVACDLGGIDLSGKKLKNADLERINLEDCLLRETDFRKANLKGANFSGADLRGADFRGADLYLANFHKADVTGAQFDDALLDAADFSGAAGVEILQKELKK